MKKYVNSVNSFLIIFDHLILTILNFKIQNLYYFPSHAHIYIRMYVCMVYFPRQICWFRGTIFVQDKHNKCPSFCSTYFIMGKENMHVHIYQWDSAVTLIFLTLPATSEWSCWIRKKMEYCTSVGNKLVRKDLIHWSLFSQLHFSIFFIYSQEK